VYLGLLIWFIKPFGKAYSAYIIDVYHELNPSKRLIERIIAIKNELLMLPSIQMAL